LFVGRGNNTNNGLREGVKKKVKKGGARLKVKLFSGGYISLRGGGTRSPDSAKDCRPQGSDLTGKRWLLAHRGYKEGKPTAFFGKKSD